MEKGPKINSSLTLVYDFLRAPVFKKSYSKAKEEVIFGYFVSPAESAVYVSLEKYKNRKMQEVKKD